MSKVLHSHSSAFNQVHRADKRKVRYADDVHRLPTSQCALSTVSQKQEKYSTAEYLDREGSSWDRLADTFHCKDQVEGSELMDELLDLCRWADNTCDGVFYESDSSGNEDDSNSGDEEWLTNLHRHIASEMKNTANAKPVRNRTQETTITSVTVKPAGNGLSIQPSVSELRIQSLLRLNSRPKIIAKRKSTVKNVTRRRMDIENDAAELLESAFRGEILDDNGDERGILDLTTVVKNDDFWGDMDNVDF